MSSQPIIVTAWLFCISLVLVYKEFLSYVDVLVDGKFKIKELDLNILFRGSTNQRLIDVQKSLSSNQIVLFDESKYKEEDKYKRKETYV